VHTELEAEVTPRDCALLLAIPLTQQAFLTAHGDPRRDFCRQFDSPGGQVLPGTIWALCFEDVARIVERVAAIVEQLGVTVIRDARLRDWSEALARHRVLTLVAHWRFVSIASPDVLDPVALRRRAALRDSEVTRRVDDTLRATGGGAVEIAAALDALCAPAARRYSAIDRKGRTEDRGLSRVFLEQALPGLRHARAIEFTDGLRTAGEVIEATPHNYPGVIDLTVCNSIVLAELLKRTRRPALIASGEFRASLAFRMIRYRVLVEYLHRRKSRYSDVLQQLGRKPGCRGSQQY
jgi:hypothetical protein